MGQPAARITDMHVCPMFNGPVPHVGGPILPPGAVTVFDRQTTRRASHRYGGLRRAA